LDYLAFIVLPYLAGGVFVVGMIYRIRVWAKTPMPGAVTLFPSPQAGSGLFWGVIKETFLFPGLFKGNKAFWSMAWLFHASLALIIVGHIRVFTGLIDSMLMSFGMSSEAIGSMSAGAGGVAGLVIMITAILLVFRRLLTGRVREITNPADYLALLLILAILVTGNAMRFGQHFDLALTHNYFAQLLTFSWAGIAVPANSMFQVHFLMVLVLVIYIPFSKILHFGGIFFTQTIIKKA
jgi:nitrate reductase gamma subunit